MGMMQNKQVSGSLFNENFRNKSQQEGNYVRTTFKPNRMLALKKKKKGF